MAASASKMWDPQQDYQPICLAYCLQVCVQITSTVCARKGLQPHACMRRPEMRFSGLEELIARIKSDVGISRAQLDMPEHARAREHRLFRGQQ